jgi:hypothetical protein
LVYFSWSGYDAHVGTTILKTSQLLAYVECRKYGSMLYFLRVLGILVTASQDAHKKYKYNTVTAVLLTEFIKLVVSAIMYSKGYADYQ